MEVQDVRIFSFFSGTGLLDTGFEDAGFQIVMANEYFAPFMEAYQYVRNNRGIQEPEFGTIICDINEFLDNRRLELEGRVNDLQREGKFVGFIGGPPCPDFSIAGKQRGRDGDNGTLSLSYVNLIIAMRPDFFLFENVKGLWKTQKHRVFYEELKMMLHNAGYATTEKLVNALEYGVPQDRERIFLTGFKRELLNETQVDGNNQITNFPWENRVSHNVMELGRMPWPTQTPFEEDSVLECPTGIAEELTVEYWFRSNNVLNHPNANDYFIPRAGLVRMQTINEGDSNKKSYKRLHRWRYSPTCAYGNNEVHLHPYRTRRISAAEALAIQSLPSNFVLPPNMSLTDKFKTIGNGVPYLLAKGGAQTIIDYMEMI